MAKDAEAVVDMPVPGEDAAAFGRPRARARQTINSRPFAGRIGGNQEFIASAGDEEILKKQPDAVGSKSRDPRGLS